MTKRPNLMARVALAFIVAASFGGAANALAEEGAGLQASDVHLDDRASLQRGAALFMNYCSGCHSLQYLRYSRLGDDLGLSEDEVTRNLNFTGVKNGDKIRVAMSPADATAWFGKAPPDLSLEGRARGADWIYTYLKSFYVDESRPSGWNNKLLPGASMPHVLWQLQGLQLPVMGAAPKGGGEAQVESFKLAQKGSQSEAEYDQTARDITAFLQYAGEPAALERESMGVWVVLFLGVFTFLAWLLKHEYWQDVH
jgi:ubiquinol-cytochrome c reductase cytochrome c1 subunit